MRKPPHWFHGMELFRRARRLTTAAGAHVPAEPRAERRTRLQCPPALSQEIAPHLPYLRRYARALTASQASGDAHVTACLEAILADPTIFDGRPGSRSSSTGCSTSLLHGLAIDDSGRIPDLPARERTASDAAGRHARRRAGRSCC